MLGKKIAQHYYFKAFGYGIYFAPYCGKSLHYTSGNMYSSGTRSDKVYMAIFEVCTGNPYYIYEDPNSKTPHNWIDFHEDHPDMDCCWASSGKVNSANTILNRLTWDEVIVYQEEQATIKYLLELEA